MSKTGFPLVPLFIFCLLFTLACSASSSPSGTVQEVVAAAPLSSVGSQVGDRITPFTLRMADGSILTSEDLLDRNRPTFILFFKRG